MTEFFSALAAIMAVVNLVALACIHYNLRTGMYREKAQRCAECNCESGGSNCNWIQYFR